MTYSGGLNQQSHCITLISAPQPEITLRVKRAGEEYLMTLRLGALDPVGVYKSY